MIKLVYCVRKRSDVSDDEFHRYWLEEHGPLVKSVREAMGAARYVQSHTIDPDSNSLLQASRGSRVAYDGITEVWWASRENFEQGLATDEGREAAQLLLDDEKNFIDLEGSSLFLTEEHEIFGD
jgi:uncharacterized protein (TIGR02118 family)